MKDKISAPRLVFYSLTYSTMTPAISAINVGGDFEKIQQSRRDMQQLIDKPW